MVSHRYRAFLSRDSIKDQKVILFSRGKFSEGFQKRFVIKASLARSNNACIEIQFTDNAGGIPSSIIDKIFDPFFTTKEVGKGTGLGLSLSRQIAQEMGGNLSVLSKNGETTFLLSAKQSKGSEVIAISSVHQATPQSSFQRTPGARFKLLLVDDEQDILDVLSHVLKDYFDITCFVDAFEAIAYLKTNPCDILMTDLKMPKMTGDLVMKAARAMYPNIGLVLMSGHAMASSEAIHIEPSQYVLINKPVPAKSSLVHMVQSSLDLLNQKAS